MESCPNYNVLVALAVLSWAFAGVALLFATIARQPRKK
jgi:hypothetical protein